MARKSYVQCPETNKLIPKDEYARREDSGLYIIEDIKPYVAIAGDMAGKQISGRKQHREFLRRNNLQEVGNEKKYFTRNGGKSDDNPTLKY
jgi:hypothetical protein